MLTVLMLCLFVSPGGVYVGRCEVSATRHGQEPQLQCCALPEQVAPGRHAAPGEYSLTPGHHLVYVIWIIVLWLY